MPSPLPRLMNEAVGRFRKVLHVHLANLHQVLVSEYQEALQQAGREEIDASNIVNKPSLLLGEKLTSAPVPSIGDKDGLTGAPHEDLSTEEKAGPLMAPVLRPAEGDPHVVNSRECTEDIEALNPLRMLSWREPDSLGHLPNTRQSYQSVASEMSHSVAVSSFEDSTMLSHQCHRRMPGSQVSHVSEQTFDSHDKAATPGMVLRSRMNSAYQEDTFRNSGFQWSREDAGRRSALQTGDDRKQKSVRLQDPKKIMAVGGEEDRSSIVSYELGGRYTHLGAGRNQESQRVSISDMDRLNDSTVSTPSPFRGAYDSRFSRATLASKASCLSHDDAVNDASKIVWSLHDIWEKFQTDNHDSSVMANDVSSNLFLAAEKAEDNEEIIYDKQSKWQKFITLPYSRRRFAWGIPGMMLISYDLITIPLEVFDLEASGFTQIVSWSGTMYWSGDILVSFLTGYYAKGFIEMRPIKVARAYATSWLPIDLLTVIPDWLSVFLEEFGGESTSLARLSKSIRMVRMLRSVRLLRVPKLQRFVKELQDRINSEYTLSFLNVCQLLLMLVVISHFLACAWYGIGKIDSEGWTAQEEHSGKQMIYMYMTSLHWSLTQFQGTMEVHPHTAWERIFANVMLIIGLLGMSMLLSSITNMIMQLQKLKYDRTQQWWALRRYLNEQKIPTATGMRVKKYIKHIEADSRVQKADVRWLTCLPEHLLMDIDYHIYGHCVQAHRFFESYGKTSLRALKMCCHYALSPRLASMGDMIFNIGEMATRMVFVQKGRMLYTQMSKETRLHQEQWVAEPVLWVPWVHVGELVAEFTTDYLNLTHEDFARVTLLQLSTKMLSVSYARDFLTQLNELVEDGITDLMHTVIDPAQNVEALARRMQFTQSCRRDRKFGKEKKAPTAKAIKWKRKFLQNSRQSWARQSWRQSWRQSVLNRFSGSQRSSGASTQTGATAATV